MRGRTKLKQLSPAEFRIIQSMIVNQYGARSPFMQQLASAQVEHRRFTGVGVFVDLLIPENDGICVDELNDEISEDYRTRLDSPCDLVGFTLFIRKGRLSFLEGYTFGDMRWPDELMENWVVLDAT